MTQQQLRDQISSRAQEGRIDCKSLLALSRKAGVPPRKLGALCDEMNIRISNCQLGCFD